MNDWMTDRAGSRAWSLASAAPGRAGGRWRGRSGRPAGAGHGCCWSMSSVHRSFPPCGRVGRRHARARIPAPGMAAPACARLGGACLRAARGLPGRGRARTAAVRTSGAFAGRLGPRPLVLAEAAPRSADGFVTTDLVGRTCWKGVWRPKSGHQAGGADGRASELTFRPPGGCCGPCG